VGITTNEAHRLAQAHKTRSSKHNESIPRSIRNTHAKREHRKERQTQSSRWRHHTIVGHVNCHKNIEKCRDQTQARVVNGPDVGGPTTADESAIRRGERSSRSATTVGPTTVGRTTVGPTTVGSAAVGSTTVGAAQCVQPYVPS